MSSIAVEQNPMSYDYIVCGGGTSGSVVAARLAENPETKVLIIEAGRHNELLENTAMVGGWSKNFDTEADWNITTEKNASAHNRQVKVSRGKFLGGSSGVNGTLCIRATTLHNKPWFRADLNEHGNSGNLHIEPHDLAPISKLLLESMESQGLPLHHDMFTTGESSHGCGHAPRSHWKGNRSTAADYLVGKGPNLAILTETTVDKVMLVGEGENLTAASVQVVDREGKTKVIKANKEVIVSGGAYCTPAILMRSGIGAKEELSEHGIDCKVNLPGVGKNLMDHLIVFMFYETAEQGITNDHLLYHNNAYAEAYRQWKEERRGPLSTFPFGAFAYARLDERLADSEIWSSAPRANGRDPMGLTLSQPNIELFTTECYGGPKQFADFPLDNKHAFSMIAELFAPHSRGSVRLASADPLANPVVDHAYLSHPLDLEVLSEACAFGNEIVVTGAGTKDIVKGSWPESLTHHKNAKREEWKEYVRENATTCYHPGGTAKMGKEGDRMAVLDEELRVRGVKRLRVVDTSVMPLLNQGHTQMPAYAIGEKAADLIKGSRLGKVKDRPELQKVDSKMQ